ncbi:hypothetical protein RB595_009355 [Gaeumannomyces hyphopodioides]
MGAFECCLQDTSDLEKGKLHPYPDISGIGVVAAFVGTAFIVLFLVIFNYLVAYNPTANPFSTPLGGRLEDPCARCGHCAAALPASTAGTGSKKDDADWWRPNPIDTMFLHWIRRVTLRGMPFLSRLSSRRIGDAFVECVILFSDIQLLTGIAILISGFLSLGCGPGPTISAYHWQMVVHLAWFAMATHLAGLSVLRIYLRHHPSKRLLRFLLTLLLLMLLLVAMVPAVFFNWKERYFLSEPTYRELPGLMLSAANASSPAVCFFNIGLSRSRFDHIKGYYELKYPNAAIGRNPTNWTQQRSSALFKAPLLAGPFPNLEDTAALQATIFSAAILLIGFFSRTVKLFRPLSFALCLCVRRILETGMQKAFSKALEWTMPTRSKMVRARLWRSLIFRPFVALLVSTRMLTDLATSQLIDVYLLLFGIVWGTCRLAEARGSKDAANVFEEENKWVFGQTLPLFLLAAPIFALFGSFATKLAPDGRQVPSTANLPGSSSATMTESLGAGPFDRSTEKAAVQAALQRDYYATAPWTAVCAVLLTGCVLLTMSLMPILYFGTASGISPLTYFIRAKLLNQLIFTAPCACFAATLLGLAVQHHLNKRFNFLLYVFCVAVGFFGCFIALLFEVAVGLSFLDADAVAVGLTSWGLIVQLWALLLKVPLHETRNFVMRRWGKPSHCVCCLPRT